MRSSPKLETPKCNYSPVSIPKPDSKCTTSPAGPKNRELIKHKKVDFKVGFNTFPPNPNVTNDYYFPLVFHILVVEGTLLSEMAKCK